MLAPICNREHASARFFETEFTSLNRGVGASRYAHVVYEKGR